MYSPTENGSVDSIASMAGSENRRLILSGSIISRYSTPCD